MPWRVSDDRIARADGRPYVPSVDEERSVYHNLGFCPWVWIKNLPGGDDVDGLCAWEKSIEDCISYDTLASQSVRTLRVAGDPTLMLKEPMLPNVMGSDGVSGDLGGTPVRALGAGQVLSVDPAACQSR